MPAPVESDETLRLLQRVRDGDRAALDPLLRQHRDELCRAVELRMDAQLRARVAPSDVVQEAQLEAARRIADYLERQPMPFRLWLRRTAYEQLLRLRRQHIDAECRSVGREIPLPDGSSAQLARQALAAGSTPSEQLAEQELAQRLREALARLDEEDREVLLLRNFEGLSNKNVAQLLGLEPATASKRYGRAILRLRQQLADIGVSESHR